MSKKRHRRMRREARRRLSSVNLPVLSDQAFDELVRRYGAKLPKLMGYRLEGSYRIRGQRADVYVRPGSGDALLRFWDARAPALSRRQRVACWRRGEFDSDPGSRFRKPSRELVLRRNP